MTKKEKVPHKDQPLQGNISTGDGSIIAHPSPKVSPVLVSVIVPAYNLEKYLAKCLQSIIGQTYPHLEIIVVDDGSTDDTAKIIERFFKKDSRIKILRQQNQGLSMARNKGIKIATGEFIALVDGDDMVAPNFIEELLKRLYADGNYAGYSSRRLADIAVCGYQVIHPDHKDNITIPEASLTGSEATIKCLIEQEDYDVLAWNKLYRRSLFQNIAYPAGQNHEDNLTTYKLLAAAKTVIYFNTPLYYYYKRKGSITDCADLLTRLKLKEQAAYEAKTYFKNSPKLLAAADVAILLAKFAYLDNIIQGHLPQTELFADSLKFIHENSARYRKNPLLTNKLRLYLRLTSAKNAFLYRLFRKIV